MANDQQLVEYLRRSYVAVDGLWFMKLEEDLGFSGALEYDRRVWSILPKIQARKAKELLNLGNGPEALAQGMALSCQAEEMTADFQQQEGGLEVTVTGCPWVRMLEKSGRLHLAVPVAKAICTVTFAAWAREFGMHFALEEMACEQQHCLLRFSPPSD